MTDLQQQWQDRFDKAFAHGAVASWTDDTHLTYLIPYITVTSMAGLDPVIELPVFSGSDKVLGPLHVTSYRRDDGITLLTFRDSRKIMRLSARVPAEAAKAMALDRERFIGQAKGPPENQGA